MKLDFLQVKNSALGAVRVTQEEDGFHFYRFTQAQEALYKSRSEEFYMKSFGTSGVQLRFKTNSTKLFMKVCVSPGSSRRYFSFEVFANGVRVGTIDNFSSEVLPQDYTVVKLPLGEFSKEFELGQGDKEIRVYFPWSAVAVVQEITLDDGATITPVKPKHKLLCFGDSITHGYDALYPSNKYISRLADALDAEEFNKAIGGEIFFPELASTQEDFVPDYITVAYGTNDWSKCSEEELTANCRTFYSNLSQNYPNSKIFAITPIWRKDMTEDRKLGDFHKAEQIIRKTTERLENVTVISGFEFVPQQEELFADLRLHPNDQGFAYYYRGLKACIENT